ncbi:MAG TPA: helix-turn-helix domain-containing protein [Acidobacteriota bacterium]|jgi:cytoskeletal protein RodZ
MELLAKNGDGMDESLGQYLKRMRTAKGLTAQDISVKTCIGRDHLQSLEAEDYPKLPPQTVTKSYVRTYAQCLRLDEADVMKRFAESAGVFYRDKESAARAARLANRSNPLTSRLTEFVSNLKLLF